MKKVIFDIDDGSLFRTRWDLLKKVKEHYPKFKVSLFWIPFDYEIETDASKLILKESKIKEVQSNLDWVELIPHGLSHIPHEFAKADKRAVELALQSIDVIMREYHLPYKKGFKAPYWLWNEEVVEILNRKGWWGAIDRNNSEMVVPDRYYRYTHSLDEPFWLSSEPVIKLHAHMTPPSINNLEDCILNLFKLPNDTEFDFVSNYIEKK